MAYFQSFRQELRKMDDGRIRLGCNAGDVREGVAAALSPHEMEWAGTPGHADASLSRHSVGDLHLIKLRYGSEVAIHPEPSNKYLMLQFILSGTIEVEHEGLLTTGTAGQGLIIESLEQRHLRWSADCEQLIIPVRRSVISRAMENITGRPAPNRYGLDQCFDLHAPSGQSLVALTRYLLHCPTELSSPTASLVGDLLAHHLIINHSDVGAGAQSNVAPYYVIRAEKYIRSHFSAQVSLGDLAEHSGVSVRTLSAAFRRFRGMSPMEWMRDYRLDQVRTWLLSGEAVTIANAAGRAGFTHAGRFSEIYRHRFGESPNVTLAAGRSN